MTNYPPLTLTRVFDAPRQAVWDAWTKPEQFKQWFMPAPFSVPSCQLDLRVGGQLKIDTQAPDGSIMPLTGTYKVIEEPSTLVMVNSPLDANGQKLFEIQQSIALSEEGGKTTLTIVSEMLFAGPGADQFLSGMKPGLEQALSQMADMLANQ